MLGLGNGITGFNVSTPVPSPNGAAGATQFVQFVNDSFAVFDKSTGQMIQNPIHANTLWQSLGGPCAAQPNIDEIAQYDKLANVWVIMMPQYTTPPYLCIAVSTTSDATGSWNLYQFSPPLNTTCSCTMMPDYPKLAVWSDAYYVSYYQALNDVYEGPAACALDRNAMLSGGTAPMMQCFAPASTGAWLPSDFDGTTAPPSGTPNTFLNFNADNQSLDLWQFHVDWTTPANSTFTGPMNIPVTPFLEPCGDAGPVFTPADNCVPQFNTSQMLGAFGDRLMYRVAYRNFGSYQSLVANHTVQAASGNNQTGIRWYELRDTGAGYGIYQEGTYVPDSFYRWMGSIAMDKAGDIALGYNVSSSSMSPSIRYTGRQASDPLGTMEGENDILSAASIQPSSLTNTVRWGDYNSMAIDPIDDCTFWYTSEYQPANGNNLWSTRIASFNFPACTGSFTLGSSAKSLSVARGGQNTVTLTVTPQQGFNSSVSLACSGLPAGMTCSFNPPQVTPTGAAVSSQLTISVSQQFAALRPGQGPFFPASAMTGALCILGWRKRRGLRRIHLLAAVLFGAALLSNCGGSGTTTGPPPVTSTVTVTATGGAIQQSVPISVTVN